MQNTVVRLLGIVALAGLAGLSVAQTGEGNLLRNHGSEESLPPGRNEPYVN